MPNQLKWPRQRPYLDLCAVSGQLVVICGSPIWRQFQADSDSYTTLGGRAPNTTRAAQPHTPLPSRPSRAALRRRPTPIRIAENTGSVFETIDTQHTPIWHNTHCQLIDSLKSHQHPETESLGASFLIFKCWSPYWRPNLVLLLTRRAMPLVLYRLPHFRGASSTSAGPLLWMFSLAFAASIAAGRFCGPHH